jgi:hypothetical protein
LEEQAMMAAMFEEQEEAARAARAKADEAEWWDIVLTLEEWVSRGGAGADPREECLARAAQIDRLADGKGVVAQAQEMVKQVREARQEIEAAEQETQAAAKQAKKIYPAAQPADVEAPPAQPAQPEPKRSPAAQKAIGFVRRRLLTAVEPQEAPPTAPTEEPGADKSPEPEPAQQRRKVEVDLEARRTPEEMFVEDEDNPANDVRRKLWRLRSAMEFIEPEEHAEAVGAVLWQMSKSCREVGVEYWTRWVGGEEDEARKRWREGWHGSRLTVEGLFEIAQRAGWRYPLAQNLNRLDETVERAEAALVRAGVEIYQNGNRLVRPVISEVDAAKGRKTKIAVLHLIDGAFLKAELTRLVDFFKWKKDAREGIAPSPDVVSAILARFGKWEFPAVTGVITAPTLRRDGSLLATEGWDRATGLLVMGPLPKMRRVEDAPTMQMAQEAIAILDGELLGEFPFVDEASRAAALSGLITPIVRASLTCVPAHAASAPQAGTGKSFLWDLAGGIAAGDAMPVIAAGANLEEMEKRLAAKIIAGLTLMSIDNAVIPLGGDAFCQAIERPMVSPRVLGQSVMRERRNNWSLFVSGNNLRLKEDATRRTLLVRLDARSERPELRQFKGNPFERVLRDRGRYLWAALTVARAYRAAGMPGRLAGIGDPFAEWSDTVRSALVWLGYVDPVQTMEAVRENDPARKALIAVLQAVTNAYGTADRTAGEMVEDAKLGSMTIAGKLEDAKAKALKEALVQYTSDRLEARWIGNKLNQDRDKIVGGLCLRSNYDSHNKVNRWWVEQIL